MVAQTPMSKPPPKKEIQRLTDEYIGKIETHLAHKEKEIMTV